LRLFQAFLHFKVFAEQLTGCKISSICNDIGGEFMSSKWEGLCVAEGMQRQHIVRNEPHQNGIAEWANRTFAEGATYLLIESHLPPSFWSLAVASFIYVHNRMPSALFLLVPPLTLVGMVSSSLVSSSESLDAQPMSTSRRISGRALLPTLKNVSSLAMQSSTRLGCSIILTPRRQLSLMQPSLMRDTSLVLTLHIPVLFV
jgi:hypothetical protein